MDPEQAKRYEAFSTVVLPKHAVRKLVNNKVDQGIPDQLVGGLAGLAKVFVVQMTELGESCLLFMLPYPLYFCQIVNYS